MDDMDGMDTMDVMDNPARTTPISFTFHRDGTYPPLPTPIAYSNRATAVCTAYSDA